MKYVYFCVQESIIKAGNIKFQDLINVPRMTEKVAKPIKNGRKQGRLCMIEFHFFFWNANNNFRVAGTN